MRLILIRHGETPWNHEGRFQGQVTVDLNAKGVFQATGLAGALGHLLPEAIFSSPLPRALSTAAIIAEPTSTAVITLEGLKEINLGDLEGITAADMEERYPLLYEEWNAHAHTVTFPGGESLLQLQERAWGAAQNLIDTYAGKVVFAVTHNFAIRTILCRFLGLSLQKFTDFSINLGSITVLEADADRRNVLILNDVSHLDHDERALP